MTSFLCEQTIDFDATQGYQAKDVANLIAQIQASSQSLNSGKVVVHLKNAHYLTTRAFGVLYDYIRQDSTQNVIFVVYGDKSKIFPPLLNWVK
jgi:phosphoglycerol transferase MdoB-like AlkP superfamily enzyme